MSPTPEPVVSGRAYTVVEVNGQPVGDNVAQFLGPTDFVVADDNGHRHPVTGLGSHGELGVRFYEKDGDRHGNDVRVWQIDAGADGGFSATHIAAI